MLRTPGVELPLRLGQDASHVPPEPDVAVMADLPDLALAASSVRAVRSAATWSGLLSGAAERPREPHRHTLKPAAASDALRGTVAVLLAPLW